MFASADSLAHMTSNARVDVSTPSDCQEDILVTYAHEAGRREHWLEASCLWSALNRVDPGDFHRVMALETGRLAGLLPMVSLSEQDSPAAIVAVLGVAYSEHLLSEVIRRRPSMSQQELYSIEQQYHPLPEGMRRSLIYAALRDRDPDRLEHLAGRTVPLLPISSAPARVSVTLSAEVKTLLPELRSTFTDITTGSRDIHAAFRQTLALRLERALVTSESDAIEIDGQWFFDSVSYPQSHILDTTADPIVLGVSGQEVAIEPPASGAVPISSGLWLAYPLTHAWGHFLLECLTRLAILHATPEHEEENALVSSAVPESFLDFARYLYPWVKFTRLDPGASALVNRCWVIPSRALTPGRFRWSADGNRYPNMDPYSLGLLGAHMRESLDRHGDGASMFPKRVYLDRTSASHRRSDSENGIRAIAELNGFHVVDPGTLSPAQEVNLFVNAEDVAGFSGSQVLLTVAMREPGRQLYFYHDESTEMRSISYSLEMCTGTSPSWILGSRARFLPGYSEQSIHQQILLSEDAVSAAREWFRHID